MKVANLHIIINKKCILRDAVPELKESKIKPIESIQNCTI